MTVVKVRRQWNDYRIGEVDIDKLEGWHWNFLSGGVRSRSPRPFVCAYVSCMDVEGDIAHSGVHGDCPHSIKVVLVKADNRKNWSMIEEKVGSKPDNL